MFVIRERKKNSPFFPDENFSFIKIVTRPTYELSMSRGEVEKSWGRNKNAFFKTFLKSSKYC